MLYLRSPKGGCCSISDDLSCSSNLHRYFLKNGVSILAEVFILHSYAITTSSDLIMLILDFSTFVNISDSYAMFIYTDQMLPYDDAVLRCITTNRSRLLTEEVISALHSDLLRKSSWFYSQTYQLSGSCKGELLSL